MDRDRPSASYQANVSFLHGVIDELGEIINYIAVTTGVKEPFITFKRR